jgi:DNA-binding NarL/FixJ family response regulator
MGTTTTNLTKVLCVEDNADVVEILRSSIDQELDMECIGCLNKADRLIQVVEELRPDVIVYDLTMPGRDSFEALTELNQQFPATPVIAFSAYDDLDHKARAIDAGAWAFLSKHGDFQLVVQSIRRLAQVRADQAPQRDAAELT